MLGRTARIVPRPRRSSLAIVSSRLVPRVHQHPGRRRRIMTRISNVLIAGFALLVGCASAPRSTSARRELDAKAEAAIQEMTSRDPSLRSLMHQAAAYIVFPEVKEGGFIVGG